MVAVRRAKRVVTFGGIVVTLVAMVKNIVVSGGRGPTVTLR